MSLRLFASQHLTALVLSGLAIGATPATAGGYLMAPQTAQYYSGSCGGCGGYVQQPQYYTSSCGGCGSSYVIPQPTYTWGSCGGCGNTYAVQQPVVQPQYGDDGGYVTRPYRYGYTGYRGYRYRSYYGRRAFRY